ncbi:cysteine proteinase inhibitor 5-like, partial [Neltuma alba]|uniref:cysteine proteinase inhibitor 5-like n=1 Tax=Neltuma alba TaxID=207710 RepID=UPI0010A43F81
RLPWDFSATHSSSFPCSSFLSAPSPEAVVPGGWTPIANIEEPHVTEIANFAVEEYDKRNGVKLKLEKVVKGETQVVATTKDGSSSATKNYEAVVREKPWEHFRNLTSFEAVEG